MRKIAINNTRGTLKYRMNFFVFSSPSNSSQKPDLLPLMKSSGFLKPKAAIGKSNIPMRIIQCDSDMMPFFYFLMFNIRYWLAGKEFQLRFIIFRSSFDPPKYRRTGRQKPNRSTKPWKQYKYTNLYFFFTGFVR